MNRPQTYVIVPAYNEAKVIRQTLAPLLKAGYHVILVDDASTDETAAKVRNLRIHYLHHEVNLGQGAALVTGMSFAQKLGAEYIVHFDADGQHNINDLNALIKPLKLGQADITLGSRFLDARSRAQVPVLRRWLLKGAILINALLTGLWLSDAHNGLRALNAKALYALDLKENGMAHATEILMEIRRHRLRYQEVPVEIHYSEYARNKGQSAWNAFNILSDLLFRKFLP